MWIVCILTVCHCVYGSPKCLSPKSNEDDSSANLHDNWFRIGCILIRGVPSTLGEAGCIPDQALAAELFEETRYSWEVASLIYHWLGWPKGLFGSGQLQESVKNHNKIQTLCFVPGCFPIILIND